MEQVEEIYNKVLAKPLAVLNIFNEFFGEELVDMQGFKTLKEVRSYFSENRIISEALISNYIGGAGFILVHFPHVTVTNENNKSIEIEHLWAKIHILIDGRMNGKFLLNRSEYTLLHLQNNYMHSHVSHIPTGNFQEFQVPCTGSGPINGTIGSLNVEFNESLWSLFCLELSKYVTVESLQGVPYHRLEHLKPGGARELLLDFYPIKTLFRYDFRGINYSWLVAFAAYLIKNTKIPFNYINENYSVSDIPIDFILKVNDLFISWYNSMYDKHFINTTLEELINSGIVLPYILSNGCLYTNNPNYNIDRHRNYEGKKVCTFKGKDVTTKIIGIEDEEIHTIYVLKPILISFILTKILNVINYKYGREESSDRDNSNEKVKYL